MKSELETSRKLLKAPSELAVDVIDQNESMRSNCTLAFKLLVLSLNLAIMPRSPRKKLNKVEDKPYATADHDSSSDQTNGSFWDPERRQEEIDDKKPNRTTAKSTTKTAVKKWTVDEKLKVLNRYLDFASQTKYSDIFAGLFPEEERSASQVAVSRTKRTMTLR